MWYPPVLNTGYLTKTKHHTSLWHLTSNSYCKTYLQYETRVHRHKLCPKTKLLWAYNRKLISEPRVMFAFLCLNITLPTLSIPFLKTRVNHSIWNRSFSILSPPAKFRGIYMYSCDLVLVSHRHVVVSCCQKAFIHHLHLTFLSINYRVNKLQLEHFAYCSPVAHRIQVAATKPAVINHLLS